MRARVAADIRRFGDADTLPEMYLLLKAASTAETTLNSRSRRARSR